MSLELFDTGIVGGSQSEALDLIGSVLQSSTEFSIIAGDLDGQILLWNEGARRVYGYAPEEVMAKASWNILFAPEEVQAGKSGEILKKAMQQGHWQGLINRVRKNGQRFTARVVITPRRSKDGQIIGFLLISQDISDEIQAAHAEENFRGLLESAQDAVILINETGKIALVNTQAEKLFGYPRQELLEQPVEIVVPGLFEGLDRDHRASYFTEPRDRPMGKGRELIGLRKDGSEFPVEISLSPLETDLGVLIRTSIRDITERKRFERMLQEKNIELEKASLAKDNFLASMSHELRTPLNAILGFTGTLLMRLPGPLTPDQEKQLRTVQTSGKHLLSLINDLLDLAKIESGKVELHPESIICQSVIQEVAFALRPQAESKGLAFEIKIATRDIVIRADRRALTQILLNLANNAIKFTETGHVCIEVIERSTEAGGKTQFNVIDTGIGIQAADQAKLFQAFNQVESSPKRRHEGTGLGLHLSGKLAELLGGKIAFQSEFGRGSTFSLTLGEG